jgi:hypothetical protein
MSLTNLLSETLKALASAGKSPSDVLWVGRLKKFYCNRPDEAVEGTWDQFAEFAKDFDYDAGYGGTYVANLFVVGDDWWLERGEYDGSEWWEFKTLPKRVAGASPLRASDLSERP